MKILIIHTTYKYQGGEDSVVLNELELLRLNGIEAELLQFNNHEQTALKVLQLPFNYSSYQTAKKKLAEFKPDVVHIHNLHYGGSPSVLYAVKQAGIPVVVTLHNFRLLCPSATLFHNGRIFSDSVNKVFPLKAALKGVYQQSKILSSWVGVAMLIQYLGKTWDIPDKYLVLGEHSRRLFLDSKYSRLAAKMVVKPNFCYPVKATANSELPFYLFIGRLSHEKGIDVLLDSFAANGLPLKIAGTGPLDEEVRRYADKYPNIEYLGHQDRQAVSKLLASAMALIFPSVWYETFGMVLIEAFSAGTPVIASRLGNLPNLVTDGETGLLFEPGNAIDLTRKVTYYHNLPDDMKAIYRKNAADEYLKKYTPEQNARELIEVYNSLINRSVLV